MILRVALVVNRVIDTVCRTNPKANVKISRKKQRLLQKEAKRLMSEKKQMEGGWMGIKC